MSTTPRRLGQYELLYYLGKGNVGEVWKARDLAQHRDVAVKIFHSDLQRSEPHFLTRLNNEGQALVSLRHPNIVPVHEVKVSRPAQSQETSAYLVMDYIGGQTLTDYLQTTSHRGMFSAFSEVVYLFTSLGVAIDHAHQQGIVHGNIKPGNILMNKYDTVQFRAGEPLLTDFGLTQLAGLAGDNGMPYYISPEQAQGNPASNRSDIYALGVLLYEICTGIVPFRDESSVAVMMQHIQNLPTPPNLINPNLPQALSEVILRAMAKDPIARFSMASLLAAAIADACSLQSTLHVGELLPAPEEETVRSEPDASSTSFLGVMQPPVPAPRPTTKILGPSSLPGLASLPSQPKATNGVSGQLSSPLIRKEIQQSLLADRTSGMLTSGPLSSSSLARIPIPPQPEVTESTLPRPVVSPETQGGSLSTARERATGTFPTQVSPRVTPTPPSPSRTPYSYPLPEPEPRSPIPAPAPMLPPQPARPRPFYSRAPGYLIVGSLLLVILVLGSAIGGTLWLNKSQPEPPPVSTQSPIPSQVFFVDDQQGLGRNSGLRIDLHNIDNPPDGKEYFAWLDGNDGQARPLGSFSPVQDGSSTLSYRGDDKHTNLLAIIQGVFVTVEDIGSQPVQPTLPKVYEGVFQDDTLTSIKNILYATPGLPANQSAVIELLETIRSINDKAASINDSLYHDNDLVIRQATRIIEMLDGSEQATASGDRPANIKSLLAIDRGLLSAPNKPGYLDLLAQQVDSFKQGTNNTTQLQHIQGIQNAITDLQEWLQILHDNVVQLLKAADLQDPAITDVALQIKKAAADSYTGRVVPPATSPQPTLGSAGALQAYAEAQYLATLDLQPV